ncbi:hypothetical protein ACFOG5_17890 [Pedobacter fastidiosus]|uniref:Phytanoyl-CoA dioxygenase (PhyH) n=1 Tax=Pedobacter fastidiosus TaxID=2765361 RepID=A0ABR7KS51_9SPHI|nr:hypothetical protein [Pedobacter fastidiosus]MBC6110543.1 hypothetical protein [Pedobacter fastidiosus]
MESNYKIDGIVAIEGFLSDEQIANLRKECNDLFSYTQLMGPGYSVRLSNFVSEVPYPTIKINSVNLLEVAVDIHKELEKLDYKDYKLAHVALYHENKNPNELIWHSDMRNGGLIRAQIVIEGGDLNSGAFRFVKGTQKLKINEPFPPAGFLEKEKDNIMVCNKKNGSLFLFDTIGYHSKCVCMDTRVSLMFDFLPLDYIVNNPNDVSSDIALSSAKISPKVIENIDLFVNGVQNDSRSANTPDFYRFNKPFSGASLKEIVNTFKMVFLRKIGKGKVN